MRKIAIIFSVCLLIGLAVFSQEVTPAQVPVKVKQAFAKQYPAAKAVKYGLDNTTYKISFLEQGKECIVTYDNAGKLVETEIEISSDKLPGKVVSSASKNFPGYSIITAVRREAIDKGICFEMDLKKDNEGYSVRFSETGEILQKEARKVQVKVVTKPKR